MEGFPFRLTLLPHSQTAIISMTGINGGYPCTIVAIKGEQYTKVYVNDVQVHDPEQLCRILGMALGLYIPPK